MNLDLSDPDDLELMQFILDSTVERWQDELPESQHGFATDNTIRSWSELLGLTGSLTEMIERAKRVRAQLDKPALREGAGYVSD